MTISPASVKVSVLESNSSSAMSNSSRPIVAAGHLWDPRPKDRCEFCLRRRTKVSGSSKRVSSRLAEGKIRAMGSSWATARPWITVSRVAVRANTR